MAAFLADGEKAAPRWRRLSRPAASAGSAAAAARTAGRPLPAELWRAFHGPAHCPGAGVGGGGPGAPERGRGATPAPRAAGATRLHSRRAAGGRRDGYLFGIAGMRPRERRRGAV